jgi:hypothetical protein
MNRKRSAGTCFATCLASSSGGVPFSARTYCSGMGLVRTPIVPSQNCAGKSARRLAALPPGRRREGLGDPDSAGPRARVFAAAGPSTKARPARSFRRQRGGSLGASGRGRPALWAGANSPPPAGQSGRIWPDNPAASGWRQGGRIPLPRAWQTPGGRSTMEPTCRKALRATGTQPRLKRASWRSLSASRFQPSRSRLPLFRPTFSR